ncbi:MAG: serine hydrolase domain-containing protein [Bacteroidales bacterium]|jgi:CubicO group peptidase (beta-lactamase class C family)
MKKNVIIVLTLLSIINVSGQTLNKNLESIVEKYSSDSLLNGSILIAKGDEILFQGSYGFKNFEKKEMNTLSTLFPIASITKQFTSTAILKLQEDKKLSIDDKIAEYIEIPESMTSVSITNLMNHTSGIPDYWQNNIYNQEDSIFKFLNKQDKLQFAPNTEHQYCNSGYFLLGEIIESVTGKSYGEFINESIFKPLGLKNTFVNKGTNIDRSIGYDESWNRNDYLMTTADGGIISTVEDLYLWDKALFENKLLDINNKELMFKPLILNNGNRVNYGFGWDINDSIDNIASHTGWLASFGAYNQIDSETGYFLILLSNQIRPELMDLINEINKELYPKE